MSSLMIRDLSRTRELDRRECRRWPSGTGSSVPRLPFVPALSACANVNVSVNQTSARFKPSMLPRLTTSA